MLTSYKYYESLYTYGKYKSNMHTNESVTYLNIFSKALQFGVWKYRTPSRDFIRTKSAFYYVYYI